MIEKMIQTFTGDIKVEFSTIMVAEVGNLRFEMDERFPWINVFINDNSDLGYSKIDELEEIKPIITHDDLVVVAMNYYFEKVHMVTEKEMQDTIKNNLEQSVYGYEKISIKPNEKTAQEERVQEQLINIKLDEKLISNHLSSCDKALRV